MIASPTRQYLLSDLPSEDRLNLHVDSEEFLECVRRRELPKDINKEEVAKNLHFEHIEALKNHRENDKEIDVAWEQAKANWKRLKDDERQSYMLQADDIPYKLRTIKYYIARERVPGRPHIESIPEDKKTDLAKLEHERFISQQLQKKRKYCLI